MKKNLVLMGSDFCKFQRLCRQKGFDLCYFGPEVLGSKESIECRLFDGPKVIRLVKRRLDYRAIPYDVAEWQKEEWIRVLPPLVEEFLKGSRGARSSSNNAAGLGRDERKRKQSENWGFFRLAATSLATGVLIILVPSEGRVIPITGFVLFLASVSFLTAEWSRFLKNGEWRTIRDNLLWYGELLAPVFITVSIASVIINWTKIVSLSHGVPPAAYLPTPVWIHDFYSQALPYWLWGFTLTLGGSILRTEKTKAKKRHSRQTLLRVGLMLILALLIGVAFRLRFEQRLIPGLGEDLFFVALFPILVVAYFLVRDKKLPDLGKK